MSRKNMVRNVELAYINSASLSSGTYITFVNGIYPKSCFAVRVINDSNTGYIISFDGKISHEFVRSDSSLLINFDCMSNVNFTENLIISANGAAGVGYLYASGYYREV